MAWFTGRPQNWGNPVGPVTPKNNHLWLPESWPHTIHTPTTPSEVSKLHSAPAFTLPALHGNCFRRRSDAPRSHQGRMSLEFQMPPVWNVVRCETPTDSLSDVPSPQRIRKYQKYESDWSRPVSIYMKLPLISLIKQQLMPIPYLSSKKEWSAKSRKNMQNQQEQSQQILSR